MLDKRIIKNVKSFEMLENKIIKKDLLIFGPITFLFNNISIIFSFRKGANIYTCSIIKDNRIKIFYTEADTKKKIIKRLKGGIKEKEIDIKTLFLKENKKEKNINQLHLF